MNNFFSLLWRLGMCIKMLFPALLIAFSFRLAGGILNIVFVTDAASASISIDYVLRNIAIFLPGL